MNQSSGLKQFDGRRIMLIGCVASLEWSVRPLAFAWPLVGFSLPNVHVHCFLFLQGRRGRALF